MVKTLRTILFVPALALALLGSAAQAQPAPPPPANAEAEAKAHFNRADGHYNKGEWREALGEYLQSVALKKTKHAMANVADCLRRLGQYDEALAQYEELRREFPVLAPEMEVKVAPAMAELQGLVGTLAVAGDAPEGASLFVDDRLRGKLPLAAPIRVGVGDHALRVEKEGFDPIVARADVKPRALATAQLRATARRGRLRVSEKRGWPLEVEIDDHVVGTTPWEGLVEAGEHTVHLKGFVSVGDLAACGAPAQSSGGEQARMGSGPPSKVSVTLYELTPVMLEARELDGALHIEATPKNAHLTIDGEAVGQGAYKGRLLLGEHTLEVSAAGFLPETRRVEIEPRKQQDLLVVLRPAPPPPGVQRATIAAGAGYGLGALGLTVSAVTGAAALAEVNSLKSNCLNMSCPADQQSKKDTASILAKISTGGLVVGAIGAAGGTAALVTRRFLGAQHPTSGGLTISVGVLPGGLEIGGRF